MKDSASGPESGRRSPKDWKDTIPRLFVTATAYSAIWLIAFIIFFLIREGIPILSETSIIEIAAGKLWYHASRPPMYGMLPLIAGSASVTLLSCALAIPFGIATALFLSEICPAWAVDYCKVSLEILSFLPSVVLGFIGMVVLAPILQMRFELWTGLNMLNASFLLGVMILPTIATLAEDSLNAVPQSLRDASYALGATKFETMFKITLPCASRGITQAAILGTMRSVGETMVVLMVAGGAAIIPEYITDPVRPLTSTIAAEMGEAVVGGSHYRALFFMGCILLSLTSALNLLVMKIESGGKAK